MAALAGLDERGTVKRLISALATASAVFAVAPAAAQPTYEYFSARAVQSSAPRQLDQQARDFYSAVFAAIDRKDWAGAASLLLTLWEVPDESTAAFMTAFFDGYLDARNAAQAFRKVSGSDGAADLARLWQRV